MAKASKDEVAEMDHTRSKYIVREKQEDGTFAESLTVGLEPFKKKWNADHLEDDDFYAFAMNPAVQAFGGFGVREATEEDLANFADEVAIAELVKKHTYWDKEQERLKSELRAEIAEWLGENVRTEAQLKSFLAKNFINTNQLQGIIRGAKGITLVPDEFINVFAEVVSKKSKGTKYERTKDEVVTGFYSTKE